MNTHYNAFISYRHHPEDSAAAQQIHRSLEHYKLPKSMERSGRKIRRLFRDKDELDRPLMEYLLSGSRS